MADPVETSCQEREAEMHKWAAATSRVAFIFGMIVAVLVAGIVVHQVYQLGKIRGHLEALLPGSCQ